jgi:hypothetical protein
MPPPLLAPKLWNTLAALAAANAKRAPAQALAPREPAQHDTFLRDCYRDRIRVKMLCMCALVKNLHTYTPI